MTFMWCWFWGVGKKMDDWVSVVARNQNQQRRSKKGDVLKALRWKKHDCLQAGRPPTSKLKKTKEAQQALIIFVKSDVEQEIRSVFFGFSHRHNSAAAFFQGWCSSKVKLWLIQQKMCMSCNKSRLKMIDGVRTQPLHRFSHPSGIAFK